LFRDNIPTVKLGSWPMNCQLFDGDTLAGPVPTLFSEDADATLGALNNDNVSFWEITIFLKTKLGILQNNTKQYLYKTQIGFLSPRNYITFVQVKTHNDLVKIHKNFMAVEFITLEEGVNLLKNPRKGHASFPYRRDKSLKRSSTGPSAKKSKSSTSAESSSGENTALNEIYNNRVVKGRAQNESSVGKAVFINFAGPNVATNDKTKYNTFPTNFKKKILASSL
jgi:hypothetical protein